MILLDPRFWLAAILLLVASFGTGWYKRGQHEILERQAIQAEADKRAREAEQRHQDRVNQALRDGAAREARLRVDRDRAARAAGGLRDDLAAAQRYAQESRAAAEQVAGAATELFGQCVEEYRGMAENADRADNEARELRAAWPR